MRTEQEAHSPVAAPAALGAAAASADGTRPPDAESPRAPVIHRRDAIYRRLLAVADMWAAGVALTVSAVLVGDDSLTWATLAVPVLFVMVAKGLGLYDRDEHLLHKTTLDEVPALFVIATLTALLLWLTKGLLIEGELGRRQVLGTWALLFVLLVCFRAIARWGGARLAPVERCLLVGDPSRAEELREKFAVSRHSVKAELVGFLPSRTHTNGDTDHAGVLPELGSILAADQTEIDRVILTTGPGGADELLYIIRELKATGVKVSVLPEASRVAGSSVELDHLHGLTLLGVRRFEFTRSSRLIKRGFDIVGSAAALVLLSPLLLGIAAAIRLGSPGPVLFRQRRVGTNGESFRLLKFRSMVDEADARKDEVRHLNEGAEGLFKIPADPRVTPMGRHLRRLQLDELPQLINVLRGEMSLVGPRPLIPEEDRQVQGWYRRRLDLPPGITGHWQVLGSGSSIPIQEMVKLDYLYVANWSLWGDVKLLLRTVPFLLRRGGV
jgi:exopolysaccharide biosynthesis polyprenyl glycosylphosphotransferase